MRLQTEKQTINLVLKTRKIVDIAKTLKSKNFEDVFFKAANDKDLDALSKIIYTLAEDENGNNPFKNSTQVYDFIDDYKSENNRTYEEIFAELAEEINNEGFFNQKMSPELIEQKISNSLSQIDIDNVVQKAVEKAIATITEEELMQRA